RASIDMQPVGGTGQYIYLVARQINSTTSYRAQVQITPAGAARLQMLKLVNGTTTLIGNEVVLAGTYQPGRFIKLRLQLSGASPTSIRLRAWWDDLAEPGTWQIQATDSEPLLQQAGAVGLRTYLSTLVSNVPLTVIFDDFVVTDIDTSTPPATATPGPSPTPTTANPGASPTPTTATPTVLIFRQYLPLTRR
ncbi:MAG TPA: hypothetical protein PKC19_08365, partial [Roseiflexaceae bacterium]|nr:hypothetical protein [Roseiflexaceae bacterium]